MAVFVADASVAMAWCFADEATAESEAILSRLILGVEIAVAAHWPLEVLNATIQGTRRGRISEDAAKGFLSRLASFHVAVDAEQGMAKLEGIRQLAVKHHLTSYDAAYLEPAIRLSLPLATLDGDLRRASSAEGVKLL